MSTDPVNHPDHYGATRFGVECIELTRYMTFPAGNAVKYIWRHADKGNPIQDMAKALVYLRWARADWEDYGVHPILPGARTLVRGLERMYLGDLSPAYRGINHILAVNWNQGDLAITAWQQELEQAAGRRDAYMQLRGVTLKEIK